MTCFSVAVPPPAQSAQSSSSSIPSTRTQYVPIPGGDKSESNYTSIDAMQSSSSDAHYIELPKAHAGTEYAEFN